jgi:Sulfotransferase family
MGADRPIFILGCPRSGTTLLQLMLHAHPRIAIPPETRFVLTTYEARNTFGDLREESSRRALAGSIVGQRQTLFYDLGLDADDVVEEIVAGPPTLGSAFGIVFRAYARRFDKPRWGDKRPAYYQYIPALLRMFPDAQIVHLIRDGRDCVASLLTMPWFNQDVYAAVCTWTEAIDSGRRAARRLPADTYFELRYEDLVADPVARLAELCDFLGEEYVPAMAEPHKIAGSTIPERKTWHADTQRAVMAAPSGTWQERLQPWEIALCETAMASRLRMLGYQVSGSGGRLPARHLARYARSAAMHRGAAYKRRLRDRMRRFSEPGPVECQL